MRLNAGDRALKGDALELLVRINEGARQFTPEADSTQALEEFQAVVEELRRLDIRCSAWNMLRVQLRWL